MRTRTRSRERALAAILGMTQDVLQCDDVAAARRTAIDRLRRLFEATSVMFVAPGRLVPLQAGDAEVTGLASDLPEVYSHYLHEDPGLPLLQRARLESHQPWVMTSEILFRSYRLLRTRYYHELMQPRAMHHAMVMLLTTAHRRHGVIAVYRGRGQQPFDVEDVAAARTAVPALTTALHAVERAEVLVQPAAGPVGQPTDRRHQALAVLDEDLNVLYRDASGPTHFTDWLIGGWHQHETLQALERRCRAALEGEDPEPLETVVHAPGPADTETRLAVELRRICRDDSSRLVLLIRALTAPGRPRPEEFRLSPRESEVANLLAEGASHAQIAARLGMSVHTVAHHAASVYDKVQVGSRAALAARLSGQAPSVETCPAAITPRERQIIAQLLEGAGNKEIAAHFGLSTATVSNHLQKIYRKMDVHDRVALIRRLSETPEAQRGVDPE